MNKLKMTTRDLCMTAIFTALTAVFAQIAIPLPFSPVPISLGIVALYAAAILLPPKCAILSQVCYLLLGAVGVPVFGGFKGGLPSLLGPTGGYLLVYPLVAAIVTFSLRKRTGFVRGAISLCAAHLVLYLGGTAWLSLTTGNPFSACLALAVYPFVLPDIAKIAFCVIAVIPFQKRFLKMTAL